MGGIMSVAPQGIDELRYQGLVRFAELLENQTRTRLSSSNVSELVQAVYSEMQKTMQNDAAVFRTGATLQEGCDKLASTFASFKDVGIQDRSLVWNTDLVETMELENLLLQATATIRSAAVGPRITR